MYVKKCKIIIINIGFSAVEQDTRITFQNYQFSKLDLDIKFVLL